MNSGMLFSIQTEEAGPALIVRLAGELDLAAAPALRESLLKALGTWSGPLVVDMALVDFIDSTGLSSLLAGHQRARQLDRPYHLAALQPQAVRLFEITSLSNLIPIHASVGEACRAVSGEPESDVVA